MRHWHEEGGSRRTTEEMGGNMTKLRGNAGKKVVIGGRRR